MLSSELRILDSVPEVELELHRETCGSVLSCEVARCVPSLAAYVDRLLHTCM